MDSKQNGKVVTPADAAASFLQQEDTAAQARQRMIDRQTRNVSAGHPADSPQTIRRT